MRLKYFISKVIKKLYNKTPISLFTEGLKRKKSLKKFIKKPQWKGNKNVLQYQDLSRFKTSDTLFILGSGSSVNELNSDDWNHVVAHDSLGINFWLLHDHAPTYHFFEIKEKQLIEYQCYLSLLKKKYEKYRNTLFICPYQDWFNKKAPFSDFPPAILKNLYLHAPFTFSTPSYHRMSKTLDLWRLTLLGHKMGRIIHHRGTVSAAVTFGFLAGYKKIVMIGVDLNNNEYFWQTNPTKYKEFSIPPQNQTGRIHKTADPAYNQWAYALTMDCFLDLLEKKVLEPAGVSVFVNTKKTKLYPRFKVYPFFEKVNK